MSTILTYAIYSINTANVIPQQSDFVPPITVFYIMSIFFTVTAFSWFILENFFRSRSYLPYLLSKWVGLCRQIESGIISGFKLVRLMLFKPKVEQSKLEVL
jgi:hypothetical protein